tara:strand:+ start:332 stop:562 length:231 start_codon:yes stop_codon:yes gene_type:complete
MWKLILTTLVISSVVTVRRSFPLLGAKKRTGMGHIPQLLRTMLLNTFRVEDVQYPTEKKILMLLLFGSGGLLCTRT